MNNDQRNGLAAPRPKPGTQSININNQGLPVSRPGFGLPPGGPVYG
jgi:hypothetical protein